MTPGGVTELIWHFAGYLHLYRDSAQARPVYDELMVRTPRPEFGPAHGAGAGRAGDLPELDSQPIRVSNPPEAVSTFRVDPGASPPPPGVTAPPTAPIGFSGPRLPPLQGGPGGGSAPEGADAAALAHRAAAPKPIQASYLEGGDDALIDLRQWNLLDDRDQVSDAEIAALMADPGTGEVSTAMLQGAARLAEGLTLANLGSPDLGSASQGTGDVVEFVRARDAARAASDHESGPHVEAGRHVNGVAGGEAIAWPGARAAPAGAAPEIGQSATLGANEAVNAAALIDARAAHASMIVLGDHFATNAIIQTNVLHDSDRIAFTGAGGGTRAIEGGANQANNVASFIDTTLDLDGLVRPTSARPWHVEVVRGDLYDVAAVVQRNVISDGDVATQVTGHAYSELRTGGNQQIDALRLDDLGRIYDLVVVLGDQHTANLILQRNVVLDGDAVELGFTGGAPGGAAGQTASAGANTLLNDAIIQRIGTHTFQPLTADLEALVESLRGGEGRIDPALAWQLRGDASATFDVLLVTGSYYDINLVSQTNVIADADSLRQLMAAGEGASQFASTGGNGALNAAAIIDVGGLSGARFLGGHAYEDAILIQANLVMDADTVIQQDAQALVTEVIAFIGAATDEPAEPSPSLLFHQHNDDVMGGVLT